VLICSGFTRDLTHGDLRDRARGMLGKPFTQNGLAEAVTAALQVDPACLEPQL
jgi:hypothetical protein